jgi:hypothetical protein
MKQGLGFVSNSSTSSYICILCGNIEGGWDASPKDLGFYECDCEHMICEEHMIPKDVDADEDEDAPDQRCPICMLQKITVDDLLLAYAKISGLDRKTLTEQLLQKFKTRKEFLEWSTIGDK